MRANFMLSVGRILASCWQQQRNQQGWWIGIAVYVLCVLAAVGMMVSELLSLPRDVQVALAMRSSVETFGRWVIASVPLMYWAALVNNAMDQNHPTLARLVPSHPQALRAALVMAGAVIVTVVGGVVFNGPYEPLACATVVSIGLAFFAVGCRWSWLFIFGVPMPYALSGAWPPLAGVVQTVRVQWHLQPLALASAVFAACALTLIALIQDGGSRHVVHYERRRNRSLRFRARARGERPQGAGMRSPLDGLSYRFYDVWFRRLLSKADSPSRARLTLGLGPAVHGCGNLGNLVGITLALAGGGLLLALAAFVHPAFQPVLPMIFPGLGIGAMFTLLSPVLQAQSRLHQTRREQALLALLPGAPKAAALSRWLSWRMTAQFLLTWAGAVLVMTLSGMLAGANDDEPMEAFFHGMRMYLIIASLPLVAFEWRRWASLRAPTTLNALVPILVGLGLAALAFACTLLAHVTLTDCGAVFALAALCWCAWRWHRMGREPSAFPVGRLDR
jgi:hypothetical protein